MLVVRTYVRYSGAMPTSSPAPDAPASLVAVARACAEADWTTVQGEALCAAAEEIAAARRLLDAALVAITTRLEIGRAHV